MRASLHVAGAAIGATAAFLGIGGGILIVPLLMLGCRLEQRAAAATSLGVVVFVVSTSIVIDVIQGAAPALLAVVCIAPASMLAARMVAPCIHRIPVGVLRALFALVMLAAALKLLQLPPFPSAGDPRNGWLVYREREVLMFVALPLLGAFVGTISTLVGIGGGLVLIPALAVLFRDLTWIQCRATSLLVVAPTALMGFSKHLSLGTASVELYRRLVPSTVLGSIAGSLLAHGVAPEVFQTAFGAFLAIAALRLLATARQRPDT